MGKDVMIKLNHVQKKYPDFSMDCSLTVYPGMITGLIGANGEGKSTTFKLILGLIGKEAGEMEVLEKNESAVMMENSQKKKYYSRQESC